MMCCGSLLRGRLQQTFFGRRTVIVACLLALFASSYEIFYDLKPGGHHGAALLAASELVHAWYRLRTCKKGDGKTHRRIVIGAVSVPAAFFAMSEVLEDVHGHGAHHGVAFMAMAELVENLLRSRTAFDGLGGGLKSA